MREIKFRQWVNGEPFYWGIGLDDTTYVGPASGGLLNPKNTINEQFTGLYDVNGKEIYEGDLILWSDGYKQNEYTAVVEFHDGCFGCYINGYRRAGLTPYDSGGATTMYPKVIGNINNKKEKK